MLSFGKVISMRDILARGMTEVSCFSWYELTWYYIFGIAQDIVVANTDLIRLHLKKVDDDADWWNCEYNNKVDVSHDQEILLATGLWISARDVVVGHKFQHFCGNGHESVVTAIEPMPPGDGFSFVEKHFGSMIAAGIALRGRSKCTEPLSPQQIQEIQFTRI